MKKIVVIGGGTMGLDIAQVFARNGYDVVVRDIKDEIIQASEARLNKGLDKLVSKGKLDEAKKAEILSHMSFTTELAAAADADLVVEAAIENLDIKKSIFAELDIHIYPKSDMAAGTVRLAQGVGGQRVSFPDAVNAEDDIALLAESRECTRNGAAFQKEGFYQYSAAWDSKHKVVLESGKTARLLFSMQEMQDGGELI